jgi:hypothetical protein
MTYRDFLDILKTFLISVVCTILILLLLSSDWLNAKERDPYTVTVDYDCRAVLLDPDDIPIHVIEECVRIFQKFEKPKKTPAII